MERNPSSRHPPTARISASFVSSGFIKAAPSETNRRPRNKSGVWGESQHRGHGKHLAMAPRARSQGSGAKPQRGVGGSAPETKAVCRFNPKGGLAHVFDETVALQRSLSVSRPRDAYNVTASAAVTANTWRWRRERKVRGLGQSPSGGLGAAPPKQRETTCE